MQIEQEPNNPKSPLYNPPLKLIHSSNSNHPYHTITPFLLIFPTSQTISMTSKKRSSKLSSKHESTFIKCLMFPIRIIALAGDMCVENITGSGGQLTYGNAMGCPTPVVPTLPRSLSTRSNPEDDLRDLIRTASKRRVMDAELTRSKSTPAVHISPITPTPVGVNRSRTVAIGRIDEDKAFDFSEDEVGLLRRDVFPRSRSKGMSKLLSSKKV